MAELVSNCPRCNAQEITFDFVSQVLVGEKASWQTLHEAFCICRRCRKSTVFSLELQRPDLSGSPRSGEIWKQPISLNAHFDVTGFVSLKDGAAKPSPDHLPVTVKAAYDEASRCVAINCYNAAAAMFRLALDLASNPLLPEDTSKPPPKVRRDLGLRLAWLFDEGTLPGDLMDLSICVREDGNDGVHRGNVSKSDAEDLQDFSFALLDRLYSEPARLRAAKERRAARRLQT